MVQTVTLSHFQESKLFLYKDKFIINFHSAGILNDSIQWLNKFTRIEGSSLN